MRIVGVIDLRHGRAVHARGGVRADYRPVVQVQGLAVEGDAVALARVYVERLGIRELYVADLDAILDDRVQWPLIESIAAVGAPLAVDAGTREPSRAATLRAHGAAQVIVGLETLQSFDALDDLTSAFGPDILLSLDLRDRVPLLATAMAAGDWTTEGLVVEAVRRGVTSIVALDLARVGAALGPDVETCALVRRAAPGTTVLSGGGVRDAADLDALRAAGCDGVLVATALHRGALPGYTVIR